MPTLAPASAAPANDVAPVASAGLQLRGASGVSQEGGAGGPAPGPKRGGGGARGGGGERTTPQGFNGLYRALPGDRAFCHRRPRISANLTPASGRQDHTSSPSASVPFVIGASASTASRLASVTIASRPSMRRDTSHKFDLPDGESEIFLQMGLTDSGICPTPNQLSSITAQHSRHRETAVTPLAPTGAAFSGPSSSVRQRASPLRGGRASRCVASSIPARRLQRLHDLRKRRQRLAARGMRRQRRIARGVEQRRMRLAGKTQHAGDRDVGMADRRRTSTASRSRRALSPAPRARRRSAPRSARPRSSTDPCAARARRARLTALSPSPVASAQIFSAWRRSGPRAAIIAFSGPTSSSR